MSAEARAKWALLAWVLLTALAAALTSLAALRAFSFLRSPAPTRINLWALIPLGLYSRIISPSLPLKSPDLRTAERALPDAPSRCLASADRMFLLQTGTTRHSVGSLSIAPALIEYLIACMRLLSARGKWGKNC